MTSTMALGPWISSKDRNESLDWCAFGRGVLERNSNELDRVIEVVDDIVKSMGNKERQEKVNKKRSKEHLALICGERAYEFEGYVTHLGISHHLLDYLTYEYGMREMTDNLFWNSVNNILRVLKRKRNGEPEYLLPKEDLKLTYGFLERLGQVPRNEY